MKVGEKKESSKVYYGYTVLEQDLFLPKGVYNSEKGVPIIFDSGCTNAVTPYASDFMGKLTPVSKPMNGLGATTQITGEGYVVWKFRDDFGVKKRIKVKAYLVPASKVRLFSPQSYFLGEGEGEFSMKLKGSTFTFANGGTLSFNYAGSLLPIAEGCIGKEVNSSGYLGSTGHKNISKAQEEY